MGKMSVGILGATGAVGQRFVQLLAGHPWFEIGELAASDRSAGKPYREACTWRLATPLPQAIADRVVQTCDAFFRSKLLFSGLDSSVAGEVETTLAGRGHAVVSNARNHRMDPDVPLLIPEVNPDHLDAVAVQRKRTRSGYIVTNPNCSVVGLAMALAPLERSFGLESVAVVTLQALSGAGYPGVASLDATDNVIPYIGGGEEEKIETEPRRILGAFRDGAFQLAPFQISSSVHRVAVSDGHTMAIFVKLKNKATPEEAARVLAAFKGEPQERGLPTAPRAPIHVLSESDRPQPRLDRDRENGMAVSVGRIRGDAVYDLRLEALVHNTIRGAAGAAILNAELLQARELPAVIVMKFGGTSVGSPERIRALADLVAARVDLAPVVVVSAFSGITDALIHGAQLALSRDAACARVLSSTLERHRDTVDALLPPGAERDNLLAQVENLLAELRALYSGVYNLGELTPRSLDAISSMGERLSHEIVAAALRARGVPAREVDARRVVITDDTFGRARPLPDETAAAVGTQVRPLLESGMVPVLGGYIGATRQGATTTLGRGGSDWSASLVGAILGADEIQIWTDVDGMMTVDPRVVPAAQALPSVTFDEAAKLAYFGAKVLHPETIRPAIERGIPVRILNSLRPRAPGTLITQSAEGTIGEPRAIAFKKAISVILIAQPRMLMAYGFVARVFEVFDRHRTPVDLIATSEVSISLTVDDPSRLAAVQAELAALGDVKVLTPMAIVSVIGRGFVRHPGLAGRIFHAIRDVNVVMISFGASDVNVSFVVAEADAERAVRTLHREFFEAAGAGPAVATTAAGGLVH